jgi:hypothetical protein
MLSNDECGVAIIGRGIAGCAVTRDSASRDSGSSTLIKPIDGGLHDLDDCHVAELKAADIARDDRCALRLVRAYG